MTDSVILGSEHRQLDEKLDEIIEMLDFIRINYLMSKTEVKEQLQREY